MLEAPPGPAQPITQPGVAMSSWLFQRLQPNDGPSSHANASLVNAQTCELLRGEAAMAGFTEILTWALCSHHENFEALRRVRWAGLSVGRGGLFVGSVTPAAVCGRPPAGGIPCCAAARGWCATVLRLLASWSRSSIVPTMPRLRLCSKTTARQRHASATQLQRSSRSAALACCPARSKR